MNLVQFAKTRPAFLRKIIHTCNRKAIVLGEFVLYLGIHYLYYKGIMSCRRRRVHFMDRGRSIDVKLKVFYLISVLLA